MPSEDGLHQVDAPGFWDNAERLLVIFLLGLITMSCIGGAIWIESKGNEPPDMLQLIGASSGGALGTILAGSVRK